MPLETFDIIKVKFPGLITATQDEDKGRPGAKLTSTSALPEWVKPPEPLPDRVSTFRTANKKTTFKTLCCPTSRRTGLKLQIRHLAGRFQPNMRAAAVNAKCFPQFSPAQHDQREKLTTGKLHLRAFM